MTATESLPALEAVRRELEIDEQAPGGHPQVRAVLTLTTNLDLAPAQLWPLLTRPEELEAWYGPCLLYTSPSPRDRTRSRMPSSA